MLILDDFNSYADDAAIQAAWATISSSQKLRIEADGGTVSDETWMNTLLQTLTDQSILSSCKFCGDANFGVKKDGSNLVQTLYDVSGTGNDLTASGTNRPTWTASVQNGKYGLVFSSNVLSCAISSYSQPNTYFVVASQTGDTSNNRNIFDGDETTRNAFGAQKTSGNVVAYAQSALTGSPLTTSLSLFTVVFNGNSSYIYRNSTTTLASGAAGSYPEGGHIYLGSDSSMAYMAGNIELFIMINSSLTATIRNAVEAAINTYYSIY